MKPCERCKFPVQWRMSVRPLHGPWLKVCEDCAEDIQRERDEDNREPSDADRDGRLTAGESYALEREQQIAAQRLK